MQPYPLWKTILLVVVTLLGALYALPNIYGEDPAVQINTTSGDPLPAEFAAAVDAALKAEGISAAARLSGALGRTEMPLQIRLRRRFGGDSATPATHR